MFVIGFCALAGLLGAYSVASEPVAYIASMSYWILVMFVLLPAVLILFVCSLVAAGLEKPKYASVLLLSCLLLPLFFIGGLQAMRILGWARYETSGLNEMRPIDEEPNGSVIVIYEKGSSFENQEKFSNEVIHPWKEGPGFTHETGVRSSMGLPDIDGMTVVKIFFSASATETEKEKLRMGLQASPIVYRYFENQTEAEVRDRVESKKVDRKL